MKFKSSQRTFVFSAIPLSFKLEAFCWEFDWGPKIETEIKVFLSNLLSGIKESFYMNLEVIWDSNLSSKKRGKVRADSWGLKIWTKLCSNQTSHSKKLGLILSLSGHSLGPTSCRTTLMVARGPLPSVSQSSKETAKLDPPPPPSSSSLYPCFRIWKWWPGSPSSLELRQAHVSGHGGWADAHVGRCADAIGSSLMYFD